MYVLPDRKYQFPLESFVPVAVDDWVEKGRTQTQQVTNKEDNKDGLRVLAEQVIVYSQGLLNSY